MKLALHAITLRRDRTAWAVTRQTTGLFNMIWHSGAFQDLPGLLNQPVALRNEVVSFPDAGTATSLPVAKASDQSACFISLSHPDYMPAWIGRCIHKG
ncbi:hypothetical protein EN813_028125 [Mesorhizobium sp. M00.F.Ca.ET.170.01.1.1]|nr:hypothetical protein EN813_028125 [Mesorhizobium sp. M00.F.Ca.ET.170.01.1.1]